MLWAGYTVFRGHSFSNEGFIMRTAALFKNGKNQAVRLPKEFEFDGVTEVEITKEGGALVLTPKRKSWSSFAEVEPADADFLVERPDMLEDGRVEL
jgi:antitoxin VapB